MAANQMGNIISSLFSSTDEQAMWRVKMQDDPQAFAQLVRRWEKPVRQLCARMTGDVHRAEDLAQEAFARIFARRAHYEPAARFSTFLWRVALNLCHDELRKIKRRGEISLDGEHDSEDVGMELAAEEPGPDARYAASEEADYVRRALLRLPSSHRVVVVLRHYEGLKFREIAAVLEIPEGTVKSRMAEALYQLHRWLAPLQDKGNKPCKTNLTLQTVPAL